MNVPVHQFVDDVTWTRGKQTLQFGGNWRIMQNFLFASTNPLFFQGVAIAGTGKDLDPAISPVFPPVDPNFGTSYDAAIAAVTGVLGETEAIWDWDYKDVAPRLAFAYSPIADSPFWRKLLGSAGKSSIRGGWGMYFDHFGEGVVNTFDRQGSFGLTTFLLNAPNVSTTDCASRFIALTTIPAGLACPVTPGGPPVPQLPPAPTPGFP